MKKTKTQKGITLVALIITIVVLLILAVVSINAIQNDGIMTQAQSSAEKFNQAQGNEQGVLGGYEEELDKYFGNAGNELTEEELAEIDLMKKYVLGAQKTGRTLTEIATVSGTSITAFKDEATSISDASTTMTQLFSIEGEDNTKALSYAKYNNKVYRIEFNYTTKVTKSVEMVYKPEGREGTTVAYDSNGDGTTEDWIIITDRDGKVEIVSTVAKGNLALGYDDGSVTVTTDIDGDGTVADDGDVAIASYNNAITTINNYCKNLIIATDNDGVRSVGGTDNSCTAYHSTSFDNWGSEITVDVVAGDLKFEEDCVKLFYHGITDVDKYYYVASRTVYERPSDDVNFQIRLVGSDGCLCSTDLVCVYDDYPIEGTGDYYSVRPVVINPAGI